MNKTKKSFSENKKRNFKIYCPSCKMKIFVYTSSKKKALKFAKEQNLLFHEKKCISPRLLIKIV